MTDGIFLVGLCGAVAVMAGRWLSSRTSVPYAAYLVLVGTVLSFVPGMPRVVLNPDVVFFVFLPPLVYHAGFVTSPRELRGSAVPIGFSALGLVLATTFAVAALVHLAVPGMGWAAVVVLGACVAPTDPVSATTVIGRMGAPHRITTILEGEGLVNDGIALTLLSVGIASATNPSSPAGALVDFIKMAGGGVVFGLVVGAVMSRLRRPTRDVRIQLVLSLAVPYLAYLGADSLGLSGILAAVVAGLYIGQAAGAGSEPATRLQTESFWSSLAFLLESGLFFLLGLQVHAVMAGVVRYPPWVVVGVAAASIGAVIVTRFAWQLLIPALRFRPQGRLLDTGSLSRRERLVLAWSGLRGAISLAAAFSVPVAVGGHPFPGRPLILFATLAVIMVTLVGGGTSLPLVIRRTGVCASKEEWERGRQAQRQSLEAALRRLAEHGEAGDVPQETVDLFRTLYEQRLDGVTAGLEDRTPTTGETERQLRAELIAVQRGELERLHRAGLIDYRALRESLHTLDLEQESGVRR